MECPKCGAEIKDSDDYCFRCGKPLSYKSKQRESLYITILGLMLLFSLVFFAWID